MTSPWILVLGVALALGASTAAAGDDEWKSVKDEDGVEAWTRASGNTLPVARARTVVEAPLCEVLAVVRDATRHCEWMASCVEARLVRRHDWARLDVYTRMKGFPWIGVADRDAVLSTETVMPEPGSRAEVRFGAIAWSPDILASDTVHMPRLGGAYVLTRKENGATEVDYRFDVDLGGWVPDWVGTRTVEQLPWRTLVNLRRQVKDAGSAYRDEIASWPQHGAPAAMCAR
jgi:hypothetical protein